MLSLLYQKNSLCTIPARAFIRAETETDCYNNSMAKKRKKSHPHSRSRAPWWAVLLVSAALAVFQQTGKPVGQVRGDAFENADVASVYDGDTFKINLNCSLSVFCEKVPVRVRGVDCPEIKGQSQREKRLARRAKEFTKAFLSSGPVNLSNCGRDKYFRLLCDVEVNSRSLAEELLANRLAYRYGGGKKSNRFK